MTSNLLTTVLFRMAQPGLAADQGERFKRNQLTPALN